MFLPLDDRHDRTCFDCGDATLNTWLAQTARQHKTKGISSTFVAVGDESSSQILGYYSLSFAKLVNTDLPAQLRKKLPGKVPVFRLGRLAVSKASQGQAIGALLLFDAIDRGSRIAMEIGGIGMVVNAKPTAVEFYKQYGFEVMADHPLNLFLPFT